VAPICNGETVRTHEQLVARGVFVPDAGGRFVQPRRPYRIETPEHPVVGAMPLPSLPFRYASIDRWLRTPAPRLGQHNEPVLCGTLGLSPGELRELEDEGVIGTRPTRL